MKLTGVVIPVFRREDVFKTIAFFRGLPYAGYLKVVIVDNGNAKELSDRLAALESELVHVVRLPENRGGSGGYINGVNWVVEHCPDAEYIWLLDDDAVPNEETLPELIEVYEELAAKGNRVACVGSTVLDRDVPEKIVECGATYDLWTASFDFPLRGARIGDCGVKVFPRQYCSACSHLLARETVVRFGFWEDVFIHFDDVEWCIRMKVRHELQTFATTRSTVTHPWVSLQKNGAWMSYYDLYNSLWLAARYDKVAFLRHYLWGCCYDILRIVHHPSRCLDKTFRLVCRYRWTARFDLLCRKRRTRTQLEQRTS